MQVWLPWYAAVNFENIGLTLMRWLFALSKFELLLFIVSLTVMVAGVLLLLEISLSSVGVQ